MIDSINKLLGEDLSLKMKNKNISDYKIHTKLNICSMYNLTKIKKGYNIKSLPLYIIIDIYKAIGEDCIDIKTDNFTLYIKF